MKFITCIDCQCDRTLTAAHNVLSPSLCNFFEFSAEPCWQLLPNWAEDRQVNKSSSLKDPVTNFRQLSPKC